jgi:hypothetical protein
MHFFYEIEDTVSNVIRAGGRGMVVGGIANGYMGAFPGCRWPR